MTSKLDIWALFEVLSQMNSRKLNRAVERTLYQVEFTFTLMFKCLFVVHEILLFSILRILRGFLHLAMHLAAIINVLTLELLHL